MARGFRPTLAILLIFAAGPVVVQTSTAQTAPDPKVAPNKTARKMMLDCLSDAARGRSPVSRCGVAGRCLDEINEAGGNLGNSAIRGCATSELMMWLTLWAEHLEVRLWMSETGDPPGDSAAILERFARTQTRAAEECLKPPADALMLKPSQCFAGIYGPFLVEEIRRGRTAAQVDKDVSEIDRLRSGRRR